MPKDSMGFYYEVADPAKAVTQAATEPSNVVDRMVGAPNFGWAGASGAQGGGWDQTWGSPSQSTGITPVGGMVSRNTNVEPYPSSGLVYTDNKEPVNGPTKSALPFTDVASFKQWERGLGSNFAADYKVPDYVRNMGLMGGGGDESSSAARYLYFKNNPQLAQDWANIHNGQLSQYATDGSTFSDQRRAVYDTTTGEIVDYDGSRWDAVTNQQVSGPDQATANRFYGASVAPGSTGGGSGSSGGTGGSGGSGSGVGASGGGASYGGSSSSKNGAPSLGFNLNNIQGPTSWNVSGNQLVQNQLANIMASDSPLIQQARTRALQAMNERGTLNSSMATSAAESAMYDAAMPIAQADAGTNSTAAQTNTGYANAFAQDSNAFTRSGVMADFNLGANDWAAQQQHARDLEIARINSENSKTSSATQFDQQNRQGYINGLNQARTDWAEKFAVLNSNNDLSPETRNATLRSLAAAYNTQIKQYASLLGWDYNSWDIEYVDDAPAATTPTATTTTNDSRSGD